MWFEIFWFILFREFNERWVKLFSYYLEERKKKLKCVTAAWKSCSDINSRGGGRLGTMWRCFRCKTEKVGLFWPECQGLILRDIFSLPSVVRGMMLEYKTARRKLEGHAVADKIDRRSRIPLRLWKRVTYSALHLVVLGGNGEADTWPRLTGRGGHVTPPEAPEEAGGGQARAAARTPPAGSIGVCSRAGWFCSI